MPTVLDHGYIELIDVMGNDATVGQDARQSRGQRDTERDPQLDHRLAYRLFRDRHTSPIEMAEFKWLVKLPITVARQWVRHRTASISEFSMRYADPTRLSDFEQIDVHEPDSWRAQDTKNAQGSDGTIDPTDGAYLTREYLEWVDKGLRMYEAAVDLGAAREQARYFIPITVYTEWIWKCDLWNTLHFLDLRMDEHASWEIQQYANIMYAIMAEEFPYTMLAWRTIRDHTRRVLAENPPPTWDEILAAQEDNS